MDGSVHKNGQKPEGISSCHSQNISAGSNFIFSLWCHPEIMSLLSCAFSSMSVLLISPKTMEQWPQCWHQAAVTLLDVHFCPKPALKWFSITLLWRWVGEGNFTRTKANGFKLKEGRGCGCLIPGTAQGEAGWDPEQSGLVECVPACD